METVTIFKRTSNGCEDLFGDKNFSLDPFPDGKDDFGREYILPDGCYADYKDTKKDTIGIFDADGLPVELFAEYDKPFVKTTEKLFLKPLAIARE